MLFWKVLTLVIWGSNEVSAIMCVILCLSIIEFCDNEAVFEPTCWEFLLLFTLYTADVSISSKYDAHKC